MLRSDAEAGPEDNLFNNIHSINVDVMLEIQKDLEPYDMTSLVFLLYDVPDIALQRLVVYERVCKDVETNNINLLYDWALYVQSRPTWRYEFLEALAICRLYNVVRKLGFSVFHIKKHYLPENIHVTIYIDPMKKVLYKICENMTFENLLKLKRTLNTYNINVSDHETCEVIFLELMGLKFMKLGQYSKEKKKYNNNYDMEELAKIIEHFSSFNEYATILRELQNQLNPNSLDLLQAGNFEVIKRSSGITSYQMSEHIHNEGFEETFQLLNQLHFEDEPVYNLKSDATQLRTDAYPIKNKNRIGVCCIINQEIFHPSKDSIRVKTTDLSNRAGSTLDLIALEQTMSSLKFHVKSKSNLDRNEVFQFIREVIKKDVHSEDSVFMLCILSHGVQGHIYAADSTKIKILDIQNLLDSDDGTKLHGIPKVLIIQACQSEMETEVNDRIVADSPQTKDYLRHFIIFWATVPEYEAYRIKNQGSFFIQCLCVVLKEKAEYENLFDIFTNVTYRVTALCNLKHCVQIPIFETSLRKKLYLCNP